MMSTLFLSTLSLRRATNIECLRSKIHAFLSTLSLRRATRKLPMREPTALHFYPRSPCGERRVLTGGLSSDGYFYPRSPCGERLNSAYGALDGASISIHALLAESDCQTEWKTYLDNKFLSTLSLRRATQKLLKKY